MAVDPVSLAITAAMMAAQMAMTASQTTEGPRVKDSAATMADYGAPMNYLVGTQIVSCPCIFAKPIEEQRKKRKGKAGKQVTYTGFGTWAVHVADHQISNVLKIWFDNQLVYDRTGSTERVYPLAQDYELDTSLRFYRGTETQMPDPDMEAFIEARDGPGTCPAYRGESYVYFERVPLEKLGNRFPDVKMLVQNRGTSGLTPTVVIDFQDGFYSIGGVEVDLEDVIEMSSAVNGTFDLSKIVPGEGYVVDGTPGLPGTLDPLANWTVYFNLTDTAFNAVTDGNPAAAFNVSGDVNFDLNGIDPAFGADDSLFGVLLQNATNLSDGLYFNISASPDGVDVTAIFDGYEETSNYAFPAWSNTDGDHDFFLSLSPDQIAASIDGGVTASITDPDPYYAEMISLVLAVYGANNLATDEPLRPHSVTLRRLEFTLGDAAGAAWTLGDLLTLVATRAGADPAAFDFSAATAEIPGFKWTQATGVQICEALCDLFDTDLRPHDFRLVALPRGSASGGLLEAGEFVTADPLFNPTLPAPTSLPQKVALTFTDTGADYNPNTASPPGPDPAAANSAREMTIDMTTLALDAGTAQSLATRRLRRERIGATRADFAVTRQQLALEPGDVRVIDFDGHQIQMRATKTVLAADGRIATEWARDLASVAVLPAEEGAPASGNVPIAIVTPADTIGHVLDIALVDDAHQQSAPFAYLVAGPDAPGAWLGADFAVSDTGELDSYAEGWASIASGDGSIIGEVAGVLPAGVPWVPDMGSSFSVVLNFGELTAATLDELLLDDGLNLAAIRSGDGWELVQFMSATLTAPRTYTVSGLLRGMRGTEWAMAGHAAGDTFVLLDTLTIRTLGAAELGDTDHYIATGTGYTPDQATAFPLAFTGAAHRPYSPVHGVQQASGADLVFDAIRRTRIGGANLNGQDVPLGQASESWALDILDGPDVVRTITGTSLPLTYTEAQQITDFGSAQASVAARLYQVDPTLALRGYPLAFAA